jgi:hypothetical protein
MSLETYTGYIKDLVTTNPQGTDPKSQGDDHLRGIKQVLATQFSGFTEGIPVTAKESNLNATLSLATTATGAGPATGKTLEATSGPSASAFSFRNKIINGNMDIWQRGTAFSSPPSGSLTADRWGKVNDGTGGTFSINRQIVSTAMIPTLLEGTTYYLNYVCTALPAGCTYTTFEHRIEGVRTLAGKTVTFSFYANADTRTVSIDYSQYFGAGGSAQVNGSAGSISLTTTMTKHKLTFTIPSIAGKTIGPSGDDYLKLIITLPLSTCTVNFTQVQIEEGSVATPFEHRPIALEQSLCERFFEVGTNNLYNSATSSQTIGVGTRFMTRKCKTPTVTVDVGTIEDQQPGGFRSYFTTGPGGWYSFIWTATAEI